MQLKAIDIALMSVFAALYAVFSIVPLFPIVGVANASITLASIIAPLIGILLGPYVGAIAVSLGGLIGWSYTKSGAFSFLSFVPGAVAALSCGLLLKERRILLIALYSCLFLAVALYPNVGPAWSFPWFLWFQIVGLMLLVSPLTSIAVGFAHQYQRSSKLGLGVGLVSLQSTLTSQMTGTLLYEFMYVPTLGFWQSLTFVYPIERIIIALLATVVGTPLIKALRSYGFEVRGVVKKNGALWNTHKSDKGKG